MNSKFLSILSVSLFLFVTCSKETEESSEFTYHYNTSLDYNENLLSLDSISDCIVDPNELDYFEGKKSIDMERQDGKEALVFPTQLYTSKETIRSIGIHLSGDTLSIALIEKEKTPNYSLDCPVWVYASLNGKLDAGYIKTSSGVYPFAKHESSHSTEQIDSTAKRKPMQMQSKKR